MTLKPLVIAPFLLLATSFAQAQDDETLFHCDNHPHRFDVRKKAKGGGFESHLTFAGFVPTPAKTEDVEVTAAKVAQKSPAGEIQNEVCVVTVREKGDRARLVEFAFPMKSPSGWQNMHMTNAPHKDQFPLGAAACKMTNTVDASYLKKCVSPTTQLPVAMSCSSDTVNGTKFSTVFRIDPETNVMQREVIETKADGKEVSSGAKKTVALSIYNAGECLMTFRDERELDNSKLVVSLPFHGAPPAKLKGKIDEYISPRPTSGTYVSGVKGISLDDQFKNVSCDLEPEFADKIKKCAFNNQTPSKPSYMNPRPAQMPSGSEPGTVDLKAMPGGRAD